MSEPRPTRHQRGIAQDFANQLAQMSVGWRIVKDSKILIGEPNEGVVEINAIDGSASVNGKPAHFGMARTLNHWVFQELTRTGLGLSWLTTASVELRYIRSKRVGREYGVDLKAAARITSNYGEAFGSYSNAQPLLEP